MTRVLAIVVHFLSYGHSTKSGTGGLPRPSSRVVSKQSGLGSRKNESVPALLKLWEIFGNWEKGERTWLAVNVIRYMIISLM